MKSLQEPPRSRRSRGRFWKWSFGIIAAIVALAVAAVLAEPTPPSLGLPASAASVPVGPLDGTWRVAAGAVTGFRIKEVFLGLSNDVVGRTSAVAGAVVLSGDRVTSASFRIDLRRIRVNGKPQPQLALSLDTRAHPVATLALVQPLVLGGTFASGGTATVQAVGMLSLNGVARRVTFPISWRRDSTNVQAAGAIPVAFADWHIHGPQGFGWLGSLADHGVAEFYLDFVRAAGGQGV